MSQKLSNAYQTALETKDFFCNGTDCNTTSKDGKGPNLIEELITPLCEQNKAKLLALNEALKSASNTASSLYDYTQQYTTTIDLTVLETNTDKGKLKTNECGEYLMLLETSSVGSPSLGIPPSSVLVAPKGKQAASSQFTEVELYQYILLREMYSSVVDCKTIALSSNYYIDGKYNEALYFVRSFLQEKSYMGASPSVNAQIRDRLIRGLLESTSPDLAVSAIKKYANLNAYFNASSVLEFAKSYAVAEVGGKIVLGTLGRIAKHPLIKNAVGKILSKFTTGAGDLLMSFKNATGINAIKTTDNVLLNKVKGWQGSGSYPGIDDWEIFEIPAGTKLYGGLPGQSEFYSVEKSLLDVNFDKANYWNSLQVSPHPQFGYRPKVGEYTVNSTIKVAVSKTLANPQHGAGGAWQVFVDDFANKVTFIKEIPLK